MATWREVEAAVPELAAAVRAVFDAHKHKVLATLRVDGSPRVSGNEVTFKDGEAWMGMMDGSVKALDLLRDPRLAVHSATADPELTLGDAKLSGRAVEDGRGDEAPLRRRLRRGARRRRAARAVPPLPGRHRRGEHRPHRRPARPPRHRVLVPDRRLPPYRTPLSRPAAASVGASA